mmetsp:Transcript_4195/g.12250  ORF Transcript_4195/g.12250 Transcript_4195/m.12250 type:complete len:436 (-) Transcript_4195:186-1493(-)
MAATSTDAVAVSDSSDSEPLEPESGVSDETGTEDEAGNAQELPPVRLALIVMMSVIQGYTLIGPLQHDLKVKLSFGDTGATGHVFTTAVTCVQYGKMVMTLGQNAILGCLSLKQRVYLAAFVMFLGCLIPLCVFLFDLTWVGLVFISYSMIGFALGVFEPTFLSVITPLGPLTKSWAIMGFPAAFGMINIVGMSLVALGMTVELCFLWIALCLPAGAFVFHKYVAPQKAVDAKGRSHAQASLRHSIKDFWSWLPRMVPFFLANFVSHFAMECIIPANLNTYNGDVVAMFGGSGTSSHLKKRWYFVVLFVWVLVGDMGSRRVGYCFSLSTYRTNLAALHVAVALNAAGIWLTTFGIAIISWPAAMLAFAGAGFNYAIAAKYIDKQVPRQHNIAAYSTWMFIGYFGAIMGSQLVDSVRFWICHGQEQPYQCHAGHHR